jgi:hypothetical protein
MNSKKLFPLVVLVAVALATTSLTTGAASGATGGLPGTGDRSFNPAADTGGNHCVSPEGVDANELLGISEYLMVPGACDAVPAGEFWVPLLSASWRMSPSWEKVPADYTPSAPTPLEDFLSKVRSMTFTADPGAARERSYRFAASDILDVRNARDFLPSAPDIPVVLFLAKLPPLPPGDHRVAFSIEMSNRHCDGLGTASENCLNAGTTRLGSCPFTVVPRQSPASRP